MGRHLTIKPVLELRLPPLPAGQLYQLAYVDLCRLAPQSTFQKQVAAFFRIKCQTDKYTAPIGEPIIRWVHLAESSVLVTSSLWDSQDGKSTMVSDGLSYPYTANEEQKEIPVWAMRKTFSLGGLPNKAQQIKDVFPNAADFKSSFLQSRGDSWIAVHHQDNQTYIIPCFELLRAFYYIGTPHLIEFFFSLTSLSTLCRLVEAPTAQNGQKAEILVVADGFSPHQLCILAELCLNSAYRETVERTHNRFFPVALRKRSGAAIKVDFQLNRDVEMEVTGFAFTYEERPFFWVCGIRKHAPYWSFEQLGYLAGSDHRLGPIHSGPEPSISPVPVKEVLQPASGGPAPVLDSGQAGDSRSQVSAELDLALHTHLPPVTALPKQAQGQRQPTQHRYFSEIPAYLTTEGGGKDLRKQRLTRLGLQQQLPLPEFFEAVIAHLSEVKDFLLTTLQLNNEDGEYGDDLSIFPIWQKNAPPNYWQLGEPRRMAIAHIQYGGGHFYFFQLLDGGRAALVYYKNARQLADYDLNTLLRYLAETRLNWQAVSAAYQKETNFENKDSETEAAARARKFKNVMGPGLLISPRNHNTEQGKSPSAAALCEKQIRSALKR